MLGLGRQLPVRLRSSCTISSLLKGSRGTKPCVRPAALSRSFHRAACLREQAELPSFLEAYKKAGWFT